MKILRRPMFSKGGSTNSGIMHGLERRGYAESNWEDIAKAYNISGSDRFSGESDFYKNISNQDLELFPGIDKRDIYDLPKEDPGIVDWVKKQDPLYKEYKTYLEGEGGIPPGEKGGPGYVAPSVTKTLVKKKYDGGLDGVNLEDVKETMSEKNKRYMQMMAPHMQKRMVADALGAASAAFGESTGNTGQDIANAITAAAAGMGGTKDIYDKVSMLTLQGEIAKDIEKSKVVKKSNYEYLYDKMMSPDPKDKEFAKSILKQDKDLGDFVDQHGISTGYRLFVGKTMPEIKGTFAGDEKSIKELKTEELGDGKYYLAPPEDTFITIKGGKITKKEPGLV